MPVVTRGGVRPARARDREGEREKREKDGYLIGKLVKEGGNNIHGTIKDQQGRLGTVRECVGIVTLQVVQTALHHGGKLLGSHTLAIVSDEGVLPQGRTDGCDLARKPNGY